jgi:hypothetical protein
VSIPENFDHLFRAALSGLVPTSQGPLPAEAVWKLLA